MRFLTDHWDLKLVALVLAVALWIYTSGQVRSDRTLDVQLRSDLVSGLGDNYQITSITPEQFRVTLSVPSNRWGSLPADDQLTPRLQVRSTALQKYEQEVAVTSAMFGIPSDIRIVRTEPEKLRSVLIKWDYIIESDLPAELPALANVPPGLEADVHLDVTMVTVRAAAGVIERERRIRSRVAFRPIDLSATETKAAVGQQVTVRLRPAANLPYIVVHAPVATIELHPVPASLQVRSLPVHLLLPPGANGQAPITLLPSRVALTVRGPENLLKALVPTDDLVLFVDLRHAMEPGTQQEQPIGVVAPSWLTFDPVSVRVIVGAAPNPPGVSDPHASPASPEHGPDSPPATPASSSAPPPRPADPPRGSPGAEPQVIPAPAGSP